MVKPFCSTLVFSGSIPPTQTLNSQGLEGCSSSLRCASLSASAVLQVTGVLGP